MLLIIYAALVLYLNMRKENILSFAYQEFKIEKDGDSIVVIGYGLGCARAKEYADSLAHGQLPVVARCIDPIYDAEDYLHRRYGIFYPKFN